MLDFPDKKIYLYSDPIDFRRGIASLSTLIRSSFKDIDLTDSLFIFFSKNARQVKIIEIEKENVWLYQDRLLSSKFIFPRSSSSPKITKSELKFILRNTELIHKR